MTELELQHKLKGVAVVVRTRDQSRRGESEEVNSTTTRSDGSYSLLLRSGRDYAVSFSLPGYEETSFEQVAVPAASSLKLDATLRQTDGILAGRTFDADTDSLLPGVLVSVLKDCNIVYQCSSDDKGCYCLNVRPNSYELRFSCDPTYDPKGVRGAAVSPGAKLLTDVALQQREGSIAGKAGKMACECLIESWLASLQTAKSHPRIDSFLKAHLSKRSAVFHFAIRCFAHWHGRCASSKFSSPQQ